MIIHCVLEECDVLFPWESVCRGRPSTVTGFCNMTLQTLRFPVIDFGHILQPRNVRLGPEPLVMQLPRLLGKGPHTQVWSDPQRPQRPSAVHTPWVK